MKTDEILEAHFSSFDCEEYHSLLKGGKRYGLETATLEKAHQLLMESMGDSDKEHVSFLKYWDARTSLYKAIWNSG